MSSNTIRMKSAAILLLFGCATSGSTMDFDVRFTDELLMPEGTYEEVAVPQTLDLAERARLAVQGLTSFLNPQEDYGPYGQCYFNTDPPYMTQINGSPGLPNWGKITDGMVMARIMSGSDFNLENQRKSFEGMLRYEKLGGSVPTARAMMALMSLYDQNPTPELKALIDQHADSFGEHAKTADGFTYIYNEPAKMDSSKLGVIGHGWVTFIHGSCIRALSRWGATTGQSEYIELAGKFKDFMMQPQFWEPEAAPKAVVGHEHAQFMGHMHSFTAGLMGLLWYAEVTNDTRVMAFVRDGYEYMRTFGIARIGLFGEGCAVGDMTFLALKMSELGIGDYWEDADCYVRNHLTELQMQDAEKVLAAAKGEPRLLRRDPNDPMDPPQAMRKPDEELVAIDAIREDDDRVAERNVGAFLSDAGYPTYIPKNRYLWTICCTGNSLSAVYQAWESIVRFEDGAAQINLLLNRASPWLDIDSHLPYEGKVVIRNKQASRINVRIPVWVDADAVECRVNDKQVEPLWVGRRIVLEGLGAQDTITINFPMVETTETWTLKWKDTDFWMESTNPGWNWKPKDNPDQFTLRLRGNTLIDIEPRYRGEEYALYDRAGMEKDEAPMKTMTRFVTPEIVNW